MGLIFNGNNGTDTISATDGSLIIDGIDLGGVGNINAGIGTFTGNLNVGGVLTYEDVKNVDSVGVITARTGIIDSTLTAGRVVYVDSDKSLTDSANLTFNGNNVTLEEGRLFVKRTTIPSVDVRNSTNTSYSRVILQQGAAEGGYFQISREGTNSSAGAGANSVELNQSSNHPLTIKTNNTERLRITGAGVVNIGDRADNTWIDSTLKVRKDQNAVTKIAVRNEDQGSSASSAIAVNAYGNSWLFDCGSAAKNSNALTIRVDATASSNQGTEKLRIATDGVITSSATHPQVILKDPDGRQVSLRAPSTSNLAALGTDSSHALLFYTNGYSNERLRIDSSGNVLVGTTDTSLYNNSGNGNDGICLRSGNVIDIARSGDLQLTLNRLVNDGAMTAFYRDGAHKATINIDNSALTIGMPTAEALRITSIGRLLIGTSTANKAGSYSTVVSTGGDANNGGFMAHYNTGAYGGGSMTTINAGGGGLIFWTYTGNLGSESYSERLRIDSSGNIGQAVTPSAWSSAQANDYFAYQVGSGVALFGRGSGDQDRGGISANLYATGSGWKYIANGNGGRIYFEDGSIVFNTCDSGTAGATATLNERFKITTDGSVMIGSGTPSEDLHLKKARANVLVEGTNDTVSGNVAKIEVRAPFYRKAGYCISDAGGNEDIWIGRPYGEGDTTAPVVINMGGVERLRITSDGRLVVKPTYASGYVADFSQLHTSNSAQIRINSPTDTNARPSLIDFSRAGNTKWTIGMGYNDAYNGFHISSGNLASGVTGSDFVVTSDGYTGIGNYAAERLDPVTSLLHVATNWDNGDVPMVHFKGCNNEAPTSGTNNISFQISDENSNLLHRIWNTGGGNSDVGKVYYAGQMGIGPAAGNPSEQLYVSKNHNGHTRAVIQNNWGANATAQLKLVSPTDEFQLVKYASGDAHVTLSNSANIKVNSGGAERIEIQPDKGGLDINNCQYYQWGGYTQCSSTWSVNVPNLTQGNIYHIKAYFSHHSLGYGAYIDGVYGAYSSHTGMQINTAHHSHTSTNGGSWGVTRGSGTNDPVVITHTGGTYNGWGHWFIWVLAGTT